MSDYSFNLCIQFEKQKWWRQLKEIVQRSSQVFYHEWKHTEPSNVSPLMLCLWSKSIEVLATPKYANENNYWLTEIADLYLHRLSTLLLNHLPPPCRIVLGLGSLAFLPCISFQHASTVSIQITPQPWRPTKHMNTWMKEGIVVVKAEHKCNGLRSGNRLTSISYKSLIYILYTDSFYMKCCTPFCYKVKLYSYFPNPFIWYSLNWFRHR